MVEAYRGMYRGMLTRDLYLLDTLLDVDYTLTHMTGYRQSKREWLDQIQYGQMQYHSARDCGAMVELRSPTAVLVGQQSVEATIWENRGTWNLQLTTTYEHRDGQWIALSTAATTF